MFQFDSKIRYSEIDSHGYLSIPGILNYFQDCSSFQSDAVGLGLEYFKDLDRAWVVNFWHIRITKRPRYGSNIKISTWPYKFDKILGYRNFAIRDDNDELCVIGDSLWVYIDTKTGRPIKPTEAETSPYGLGTRYDIPEVSRKIKLPENMIPGDAFPVVRTNIDTNKHVNNEQYIEMAMEYLPSGKQVENIFVEYRTQAVLGDIIHPKYEITDTTCTVALCNEKDKPYAIVKFEML
ncbi:MAG: acyl-[acyl-carrier-protein] thioesterase [Lachnospiraceae bacterium]|nr:acyl-[acyl-carrier-protein] thioesterase [Lachnospiraceae bacterium]